MSKFGGFAAIIVKSVYFMGYFMNNRMLFAKFIRTLYLINDKNDNS